MPYYKDTSNSNPEKNGIYHLDSADHAYLIPATCVLITDAEGQAEESAWLAARESVAALLPNPSGFIQAVKTSIGLANLIANTNLYSVMRLAEDALQQNQMADLQTIITSAQSGGLITATQYSGIKAAATQFNIPVTLP